jgi:hypothetical protein
MPRSFILFAFATLPFLSALGCGAAPSQGGDDESAATEDAIKKGKTCHTNSQCGALEFCDKEHASSCHAKGVCAPRGVNLMCSMLYAPVCGCDGTKYSNTCVAHKAGASVAHALDTNVTMATLTQPRHGWVNESQAYFYAFDSSGTFTSTFELACVRSTPRCMVATVHKQGTFVIDGGLVTLTYEDGTVVTLEANPDCDGTWTLTGNDWNQDLTLSVSSITP